MDPHCNSPCPIALLLVAFAFGRPSCSNFGGQSFRRFLDPHCNSPCPIALLLVVFAFGRPSCSNFGGQSFRRFFRKTKLIKFLGVGDWSLRGSDLNLIKSLESGPGLPEDQLDQILGQDQSSKTDRTRAEEFWGRYLQQICTWFVETCRFTASRGVADGSKIEHCT